jgi:hypothetical protein
MDTRAHGQSKGPYGESDFECYTRFETQEDTPTRIRFKQLSIWLLSFRWLKGKLQKQQFTDPDQLFETVDEIFSSFSVDAIKDVFRN